MELAEDTSKAVEDIQAALLKGRDAIRMKYEDLLDDMHSTAMGYFMDTIENDFNYNCAKWISREVSSIVEGLISGNEECIERMGIVSEYTYGKRQEMRLAIYAAAKDDILTSALIDHKQKIDKLQTELNKANTEFYDYRMRAVTCEHCGGISRG